MTEATWEADPTGRCEYRLRGPDGEWTDKVLRNGVEHVDPWAVAEANPRPQAPWRPGDRYCWRCELGAVAGETACSRCGRPLATMATPAEAKAKAKRTTKVAVAVVAAVVALVAVVLVAGVLNGPEPEGHVFAERACAKFRVAGHDAVVGVSTNQQVASALRSAQSDARDAASLNGRYLPLARLMTDVVNGTGSVTAVLAECRAQDV